jgi:putative ABC transport system permease protein
MFSIDRWQEILDTLWRNKLRTTLTALSMAWGIFMLVVLLGLGNGLQHGVEQGFADDATNSVWMFAGNTSVPSQGLPIGRKVILENKDVDTVGGLDKVDHVTGRFFIGGGMFSSDLMVRAGTKATSFDVRSVNPGHLYIEKSIIQAGRFIDQRDIDEHRKVTCIGVPVAQFLFGTTDVIGKWLEVNHVPFEIVGLFLDQGEEDENKKLYIPITTAQRAFNGQDHVNMVMFTVGGASVGESKEIEKQAMAKLAETHHFEADDPQAVRIRNNLENFENFQKIFTMIGLFVKFMALCAILAGVVGVSNIMMIVVRERTKEIGIRKALGATPTNIITSIVQEAVFLTTAAGYMGLVGGVALLTLIDRAVPKNDMFAHPDVDLGVALWATGLLVLAGALAGFFPARAAAKVNPIVALRDE